MKGYLGLFCKAFSLNYWVVELSVSIADLPLVHKQLKPLCHAWLLSMPDNTEDAGQAHDAAHSLCCVLKKLSRSLVGQLIVFCLLQPVNHASPCMSPLVASNA